MRTRLQGIMATMMLIVGSLLIIAAPAAAEEEGPVDQPPVTEVEQAADEVEETVDETEQTEEEPAEALEEPPATTADQARPDEGESDPGLDEEQREEDGAPEEDGASEDAADDEDEQAAPADEAPADEAPADEAPADEAPADDGVVHLVEVIADVVPDVDVCVTDGLDWTRITTDAENAAWLIANEGAQLAGESGCLVRVCRTNGGNVFPAWFSSYATPADAEWILAHNDSAYIPQQGAPCPANEPVTICRFKNLDYNEVEVDPHDANWLIKNGDAVLPGDSGCLVRVCRLKTAEHFTFWFSVQATPEDAAWIVSQSPSSYIAKKGVPCPGNENVTICQLLGSDYKAQQYDPQTAEWLLATNPDYIPATESGCPVRVCEATGSPYNTWKTTYSDPAGANLASAEESLSYQPEWGEPCPTDGTVLLCDADGNIVEVDPQGANNMVNNDGAVEPTEGECPTPAPEPEPTPEEEVTPPPPTKKEDGEVLSETQTRTELAQTGAESTHVALVGLALILGGLALVGTSRLRRPATVELS